MTFATITPWALLTADNPSLGAAELRAFKRGASPLVVGAGTTLVLTLDWYGRFVLQQLSFQVTAGGLISAALTILQNDSDPRVLSPVVVGTTWKFTLAPEYADGESTSRLPLKAELQLVTGGSGVTLSELLAEGDPAAAVFPESPLSLDSSAGSTSVSQVQLSHDGAETKDFYLTIAATGGLKDDQVQLSADALSWYQPFVPVVSGLAFEYGAFFDTILSGGVLQPQSAGARWVSAVAEIPPSLGPHRLFWLVQSQNTEVDSLTSIDGDDTIFVRQSAIAPTLLGWAPNTVASGDPLWDTISGSLGWVPMVNNTLNPLASGSGYAQVSVYFVTAPSGSGLRALGIDVPLVFGPVAAGTSYPCYVRSVVPEAESMSKGNAELLLWTEEAL